MVERHQTYTPFLTGKLVTLRSVEVEDLTHIACWMNDAVVTYFMFTGQRPLSQAQAAEEIHGQIESPNNVVFLAQDRSTGQPIGTVGLYDIHPTARKAEFRILIGERAFWSRGYGTEMTEMALFYAFDRLNLNRVWLGVTSESKGAIRAYEKAGFRREGVLRQEIYRNSRYYDSVRMSILREEYYKEFYDGHAQRYDPVYHSTNLGGTLNEPSVVCGRSEADEKNV